ncbi:RNA ligase family protein [Herbidospora galbida]|uniref:RNA ligase family protein n=1 Tax=Herbidospora galbida TaxID=2575442 RepID=UPI00148599D6
MSDGGTTRPAGRRGVLEEERFEAFFGVTRLWPVLATAAAAAARAVQGESVLYGELAGGGYPHPDVASVDGVGPVQTGVWYSPDLVWLTFDGAVRSGSGVRWLGRDELGALVESVGLSLVPLVGRGRRTEVLELPVDFDSLVPRTLGLPELAGNRAEGYVVKPAGSWDTAVRGRGRC